MLAADHKSASLAPFEVAVSCVEVALVVEHAPAAVAELASVNAVVIVVEREERQCGTAVLEQAVAIQYLRRGNLLAVFLRECRIR